jgi:hypothetical protein
MSATVIKSSEPPRSYSRLGIVLNSLRSQNGLDNLGLLVLASAKTRFSRLTRFQVIGGNAWQSVTRRTMRLSAKQGVDKRYLIPANEEDQVSQGCRSQDQCANLSRKRYLAVLRLR